MKKLAAMCECLMRQAFFDIKVVSPYARSYLGLSPAALYQKMEKAKIREYRARINEVDKGDFTPLVFTMAGGTVSDRAQETGSPAR